MILGTHLVFSVQLFSDAGQYKIRPDLQIETQLDLAKGIEDSEDLRIETQLCHAKGTEDFVAKHAGGLWESWILTS